MIQETLSIIVPTFNESKNIHTLIEKLEESLKKSGIETYEILIMDDDSPDGTCALVNDLRLKKVRAVNRAGKPRGLSQAVLHGFKEARGQWLAVMDADLSHPPEVLPKLALALQQGFDVAVGSRYVKGGGIVDWPLSRRIASKAACLLAQSVTKVQDATSGFFAVKKKVLEGVTLNPLGFKIGLEVYVKAKHKGNWIEIPYVFTDRQAGQSKLNLKVIAEYFKQLSLISKK